MFSATFSDDIRRLSRTILRNPVEVEVAPRNATIDTIRQLVYPVDRDRKEELLAHLIRSQDLRQVLVFTRTKIAASRLASWLDRHGIDAVAIHSDRSQPERTRALEEFKSGEIRVLVATDVAARGLDIEDLPHVVNFELPWNPQDYIHRIGRTGRAGQMGDAISLVCIDETDLLRGVQRLLRKAIPWTVEEGFIPDRNTPPRPLRGGPDRGASGAGRGARPDASPPPPQAGPTLAAGRAGLSSRPLTADPVDFARRAVMSLPTDPTIRSPISSDGSSRLGGVRNRTCGHEVERPRRGARARRAAASRRGGAAGGRGRTVEGARGRAGRVEVGQRRPAAGHRWTGGIGRGPAVAASSGQDHLGAREEEPQHQVGLDPVDRVAVDEQPRRARLARVVLIDEA